MQSLIIHLTGTDARRENVATLRETLPDARIVPAVVGRTEALDFPTVPGTLHAPSYPFPLSAGERGCFLSHRRCWEAIADGPDPFALIVEDDLHLDPILWPDALALIVRNADEACFIRLPAKEREQVTSVTDSEGAAKLFTPRTIGLQTVAQVVGRQAAQRLLAATRTIDRPVDTTLQMHWVTGQRVQTILHSGVSEHPGPSTIQKKSRTSGKLMREIRRAIYRARVRRRPQV